ncbi:MAG TPA: hypothetical protein VK788_26945 [Terriglobales bacterium]|jgi:hypothetical protein|nr:hypothetical protein [Terriglobales bacterium]
MLIPKPQATSWRLSIVVLLATLALLPACSVNVKDKGGDGNSKVDISTPVGGIHVDENADARDTGLSVYPGARPKPKSDDGDKKSANVNMSAFGYGLKVVALEYVSDDPPDKIIAYYQDQLKRYGHVLQCHSSGIKADHDGGKLKCDSDDSGNKIELKAGTDDNQHIVSVEPEGKGSDFAIVWLRLRGKEGDI